MQNSYSYPCYDYSKTNSAAFHRTSLSTLKQQHLSAAGSTADKLASLSAYPPKTSPGHIYAAQQSITGVAAQPFGMPIVRHTAQGLFNKESLPKQTRAKEIMLSSVKKSRHLSEHHALKTKVIGAIESNNPTTLASLTKNDGFLTMCLHDKDLLQAFRGILHSQIMSSPLTQQNSTDIRQMQHFINLQPAALSMKLQQANSNFYTHGIEAKTNQQMKADFVATGVKAGIAAVPFVGSVAGTAITAMDTIGHMNLSEVSASYNTSGYHSNPSSRDKIKHHLIEEYHTGSSADNPSRYSKVKIMPTIAGIQTGASPAVISAIGAGSIGPLIDPLTAVGGAGATGIFGAGSATVKNIGSKKTYLEAATYNLSVVGPQSIPGSYSALT